MNKKKTVPVTIRLDEECVKALRKNAQEKKKSFNSHVHEILDRYVDFHQHLEPFEPVILTKKSFRSFLDGIDQKQCIKLSTKVAKNECSEFIHFRWGKMDFDSILMFMKMFFDNCGYGKYVEELKENLIILRIRHGMGKNGSLYIQTFIETLFGVAKLPKPGFISTNDVLTIKIQR